MRAALLLLVALAARCMAHGDLHEQIVALSTALAQKPGDAELHFQRAELHRAHGDYPAALADYDQSESGLSAVQYGRALTLIALQKNDDALTALDRCIAAMPGHFKALAARAHIFVARGEMAAAVADFDKAISLSPTPDPDFFLFRAYALCAASQPQFEVAAAGLREGMSRLGDIVSLGLALCHAEVQLGHYDEALAVVDRLRARTQRQETWLVKRGEILLAANRPAEAAAAFREARTLLHNLPPELRATHAMQTLESSLRVHLPAQ